MSAIMSHFSQVAWLSVVFERLYGTVFGDEIFPSFLRDIVTANEKPGQSHGAIGHNIFPVLRSTSKMNDNNCLVTERPQTKTGRSFVVL